VILACVLECSSIGAMVFLTIVVVITRIGVNKELPLPADPAPVPPIPPAGTGSPTEAPAPRNV
jgi:hypothetical protein